MQEAHLALSSSVCCNPSATERSAIINHQCNVAFLFFLVNRFIALALDQAKRANMMSAQKGELQMMTWSLGLLVGSAGRTTPGSTPGKAEGGMELGPPQDPAAGPPQHLEPWYT